MPVPGESEVVLVADEDPDLRHLIRVTLSEFRVIEAEHGELAWRRVQEFRPAVAILGVQMPGRNGLDLARTIKADRELRSTRVILLSARRQAEQEAAGLSAGADLYLTKPISPLRLIREVDNAVAASRAAREPGRPKRVLVVDDEPSLRDLLTDVLEGDGYQVVQAANGAEALQKTDADPPDLVVLDLMMPVMNGWAFLAERSRRPDLARIPVIVLSGVMDQSAVSQVKDAGAMPLAKPFDVDVLLSLIDRYAAGS